MLTSTDPRTGAATITDLEATSAEQAFAVLGAAKGAFLAWSSHHRLWRAGMLHAIADAP